MTILGVFMLLVGVLLLSGASLGRNPAPLRPRGAERGARAALAPRAAARAGAGAVAPRRRAGLAPPVDAVEEYPDVVSSDGAARRDAPMFSDRSRAAHEPARGRRGPADALFDADAEPTPEYSLPDRRPAAHLEARAAGPTPRRTRAIAGLLVQRSRNFGVDANVDRPDRRPARDALRAAARAGTKVVEGRRR